MFATNARPSDADRAGTREGERAVIKVCDDVPYKVTGPVELVDADGNRFAVDEGRAIALCRCGRWRDKPFCDRSHRDAGCRSCERVARATAAADPA